MNLVIDWGNTRIKAAFFDNDVLLRQNSFTSQEELISFLENKNIEAALVSSVNGDSNALIGELNPAKIVLLSSATPLPISNLYATPKTLGADRLAAACGAWAIYPHQTSLVIDLGSCINYELVDEHGNYLGGVISPGVSMRFQAMHQFTAKLPTVQPSISAKLIGNSTETCMQSGVMNGILAEIQGFIAKISNKHPSCNIVICGGDAHFFEDQIKETNFVPDIVLIGLNSILSFNLKASIN
jgi:type III pantothenate kinase